MKLNRNAGVRAIGVAIALVSSTLLAQPANADETPIQLEQVSHSPERLPGLSNVTARIYASAFGGTLEFDGALRLQRFRTNGGFAPIDFKDGAFHVLGGIGGSGFLGYAPVTSIMRGEGNPTDASAFSTLPALDLFETPTIDNHELLTDAQGNYWFLTYPIESCDAYPGMCGANTPQSVDKFASCVVNQVSPSGQLLYQWSALENLPQSELRYSQWVDRRASTIYAPITYGGEPAFADPFHCNSIDVDDSGNHILVTMRHTDAVYMISKNSGRVLWKVGGNRWRGVSLSVTGLPKWQKANPLAGQHDARIIGSDAFSVFDNSTGLSRPARGMIFNVNLRTRVANASRVMASPFGESSNCTGSFRPLAHGRYWVAGWGCAVASATVFDSAGRPIVSLRPAPSAESKAYFAAIWPGGLSDVLVQQLSYRFTPSGSS